MRPYSTSSVRQVVPPNAWLFFGLAAWLLESLRSFLVARLTDQGHCRLPGSSDSFSSPTSPLSSLLSPLSLLLLCQHLPPTRITGPEYTTAARCPVAQPDVSTPGP